MNLNRMRFSTGTFLQEASERRNADDIEVGLLRAGLARFALVGAGALADHVLPHASEAGLWQVGTAMGILEEYTSDIDKVISNLKAADGSRTSRQDQSQADKIKVLIELPEVRPLFFRLIGAFLTLGITESNLRHEMSWNAWVRRQAAVVDFDPVQVDVWRVVASTRSIHTKPDADLAAAKARVGTPLMTFNDDRLWDEVAGEQYVFSCLNELWRVAAPLPEANDAG